MHPGQVVDGFVQVHGADALLHEDQEPVDALPQGREIGPELLDLTAREFFHGLYSLPAVKIYFTRVCFSAAVFTSVFLSCNRDGYP